MEIINLEISSSKLSIKNNEVDEEPHTLTLIRNGLCLFNQDGLIDDKNTYQYLIPFDRCEQLIVPL